MKTKIGSRGRAGLLGWMLLMGGVFESAAFQQVPLTVEELASRADCVVRGLVEGASGGKDPAGRIYTRIDFKVLEVWKGRVGKERMTLVHSGGEFEGRRVVIPGQVAYTAGQEAVAFLVINSRGEGVTVGLAQGKFDLWTDPVSGAILVRNHVHNPIPRSSPQLQNQPSSTGPIALSELRRRVQGGQK